MNDEITKVVTLLQKGAVQCLPVGELAQKLKRKQRLCIKLGVDPTAPDLHLGHAVVLAKMREFQDLGHKIIFLIGDFTARIGDPTGKSKTRPPLTDDEVAYNIKTYFEQVGRILDLTKTDIRYNSHWLGKLDFKQLVALCAKVTVSQLIEREDFAKRLKSNQPIGFHELLYPLMQGYDSVELQADVELGGTDQTFNLLMGRHLQEQFGQEAQVILTTPLLIGLDGTHKMSKSLNNIIGLTENATDAFGKLMSISDELMLHYYEILLNYSLDQLVQVKLLHPMVAKKQMSHAVITKYWSCAEAGQAQATFEKLFQQKDYSAAQLVDLPIDTPNQIWIIDLLRLLSAIKTSSDAKRLISEGAIKVDGQAVTDFKAEVNWRSGTIIKVGKHRIYQIK
jgi:tyrosyl-tRNA synthetase